MTANPNPPSLRVGGLTPMTTIDFPDQLSAVIYCQGCPLHCDYCHNPELLPSDGTPLIPWRELVDFLEQRRGLLDAVVFSGGEPTLQSGLIDAVKVVKSMDYLVGLHTAGIYPKRLARVLPYLDWVGLDIKALEEDYHKITGVPCIGESAWQSAQILVSSGTPHQLRTTHHPANSTPDKQKLLIKRLTLLGNIDHVWQTCRPHDGHMD
ncbi:MAG: anaerobic ribonucleoside-triphosphate reductase activating protein [Candidatus Thiodiazotropha sp. LLP2]